MLFWSVGFYIFIHNLFIMISSAKARNSSFGFFSVGLCVGKNQMCCLCGWVQLAGNVFVYETLWVINNCFSVLYLSLLYAVSFGSFLLPQCFIYVVSCCLFYAHQLGSIFKEVIDNEPPTDLSLNNVTFSFSSFNAKV